MMHAAVVVQAGGGRIAQDDRHAPLEWGEHEACGDESAQAEHRENQYGATAARHAASGSIRSLSHHALDSAAVTSGLQVVIPCSVWRVISNPMP